MGKNEFVVSEVTGKTYDTSKVVRILNVQQIIMYLKHGVELLDIYASEDFKTGKPVLVGLFDRAKSYEAYDLWCKHELK